jgi:hypothetical protein
VPREGHLRNGVATMSDADLSALRRAYEASRDPWDRWRWRVALVRAGRRGAAGFETGDIVHVDWHVNVSPELRARTDGWTLADPPHGFEPTFGRWCVTMANPSCPGGLERRDIFDDLDILTLMVPARPDDPPQPTRYARP